MNRLLCKVVKFVWDMDEEYIQIIGCLNFIIGVNIDYVKCNFDWYIQQKMIVGDYIEFIKCVWMEI